MMAVDDAAPTDAEARAWFTRGVDDAYSLTADPAMADGNALFDRWLEAHDRRLIAKAVRHPEDTPDPTAARESKEETSMTWYAVASHLGSLTFTRTRPSGESLYCDQCDDRDDVYGPVRFTPDGVLALAEVLCGGWPVPPAPWDDAESWLDDVAANVDRIAHEAPVAVDAAGLKRLARRRLHARWAAGGLLPFDRYRCVEYFATVTKGLLANDPRLTVDPAGVLLGGDFVDETDPWLACVPAPWLGCLLEARMRVVSGYRPRWLDMMDAHPGWRLAPAMGADGKPWHIPVRGGGTIAVRWFEKERRRG